MFTLCLPEGQNHIMRCEWDEDIEGGFVNAFYGWMRRMGVAQDGMQRGQEACVRNCQHTVVNLIMIFGVSH